jgi:hypothetical protein
VDVIGGEDEDVVADDGFFRVRHDEKPCLIIFCIENFALGLLRRFVGSLAFEFDSVSNEDDDDAVE